MHIILNHLFTALCLPFDVKGPQFTREPPTRLHFSNDTGAKIDCIATGTPPALVEWILGMHNEITIRHRSSHFY